MTTREAIASKNVLDTMKEKWLANLIAVPLYIQPEGLSLNLFNSLSIHKQPKHLVLMATADLVTV